MLFAVGICMYERRYLQYYILQKMHKLTYLKTPIHLLIQTNYTTHARTLTKQLTRSSLKHARKKIINYHSKLAMHKPENQDCVQYRLKKGILSC